MPTDAGILSPPVMPFPVGHPFPLPSCPTPIGHPGQQSPYFSDASMSIKAELVFLDARMRKHDGEREARMTVGGVLPAVGSFYGRGCLSSPKSGIHVAWILVSSLEDDMEDDIKRIPDIVKRPDYITLGNKTNQNKDAITYVKNAPEGTTYYVEEIRNKRRRLSGDTMYKRKGAPVQPAAGLINSPTGLNALSDTGRILNIYYPNTVVKGINNFQPFISTAMTGGSLSGMYKLLSHDKDQEGAPTQPAAELIQFPASPNVRNDVGRTFNIDYPNTVVKGGEEALFEEELPRSRMCTYQAHQSGYTAGDSSLRPAGGEADQEIAYFTPSVKRENEITSSCVGSPAQEPLTAVSDLLTYDIDPTGAEALLDAGLDEKEILSRHRAYDMSLSEVTAQRILGSDAASSRLKALKETLSGMLPGLKEASRRQGHRFYSEAPSVQSRLLEEAYLTAMGASADDVSVPEAHRLMGQGRKEAAYGVHGGPYYQDDLSDFWHMIAAV